LELDSGTRLMRAVQVFPGVVRLTGPADLVARIDSVKTLPLRVEKVEGVFERSVAVDTEGFGTVRAFPTEVMISFEVLPDTGKREGQ
jgi:hypothetical protein